MESQQEKNEKEKGNNIPFYLELADAAFKSGIVSTLKSTNKRLAEKRITQMKKLERQTEAHTESIRKDLRNGE